MNSGPLFADAGPPDVVFIPFLGVMGVAGIFLVVGLVAGGFWLLNGPAAQRARKLFLVAGAFVCSVASLFLGMMWWFWEEQHVWIGALVFLALAFLFSRSLWLGRPAVELLNEPSLAEPATQ